MEATHMAIQWEVKRINQDCRAIESGALLAEVNSANNLIEAYRPRTAETEPAYSVADNPGMARNGQWIPVPEFQAVDASNRSK
jgi:hypothetical protein